MKWILVACLCVAVLAESHAYLVKDEREHTPDSKPRRWSGFDRVSMGPCDENDYCMGAREAHNSEEMYSGQRDYEWSRYAAETLPGKSTASPADVCDGRSPVCPPDQRQRSVSKQTCPTDRKPEGYSIERVVVCRSANGMCDVEELAIITVCRPDRMQCDQAEPGERVEEKPQVVAQDVPSKARYGPMMDFALFILVRLVETGKIVLRNLASMIVLFLTAALLSAMLILSAACWQGTWLLLAIVLVVYVVDKLSLAMADSADPVCAYVENSARAVISALVARTIPRSTAPAVTVPEPPKKLDVAPAADKPKKACEDKCAPEEEEEESAMSTSPELEETPEERNTRLQRLIDDWNSQQ